MIFPINKIQPKYIKLMIYDKNNPNRSNISPYIANDRIWGEDRVADAKEIIITEGIPDYFSAIDNGFVALSPGTVRFNQKCFEKLGNLTTNAHSVYIINDNEVNKAGQDGAEDTAKYLVGLGRNVYVVELPRPSGAEKIDLNEYFLDHSADDLKRLMDSTKSYLDTIIDKLPDRSEAAIAEVENIILPLLINLSENQIDIYSRRIAEKTNIYADRIKSRCWIRRKK